MRIAMLTLLLCAGVAWGEEATPGGDALLEAARHSPVTLRDAWGSTYVQDHRPLRAEFLRDTRGQLLLRVLVRVMAKETLSFEEWCGPVGEGGWIPRERTLTDAAEVEAAGRVLAFFDPVQQDLREALHKAVRSDEAPDRPADVVLSIEPVLRDGRTVARMRVVDGGRVGGLAFDLARSRFTAEDAGPGPTPVPPEAREIPELAVPDGRWFNTTEAPSLAAWRGSPILVLVTSPG